MILKDLFEAALEAVKIAETEIGAGKGKEKKELAVSIAVKILKTPFGDRIEAKFLNLAIDLIVFLFNKYNLFEK